MDRLGGVTFMDHSRAFRARLAPLPTDCMNRAPGQPRHTIESDLAPLNTGLATACHQAQDRPTCIERCRSNGSIRQRRSHSMMTIMKLRPRGGAEVRGANVLHSAAARSVPFASVEGHQLCCREPGYQDLLAQRRPIVQSNCHTA